MYPQISPNFKLTLNRLALAIRRASILALLAIAGVTAATGQTVPPPSPAPSPPATQPQPVSTPQTAVDRNESERSDKLTGGRVEVAEFAPSEPNIRLTLNIPRFA